MSEAVFIVDRTGSMRAAFAPLSRLVLRYAVSQGDRLDRVGLVLFDDHYPAGFHGIPTVVETVGITENLEEFGWWLHPEHVAVGEGDDLAEAVACAIAAARKLSPQALYWLVTDAFPHGTGDVELRPAMGANDDNFPNGCPCGTQLDMRGVRALFGGPYARGAWQDDLLQQGRALRVEEWEELDELEPEAMTELGETP